MLIISVIILVTLIIGIRCCFYLAEARGMALIWFILAEARGMALIWFIMEGEVLVTTPPYGLCRNMVWLHVRKRLAVYS